MDKQLKKGINMKKILLICSVLLTMMACQEDYDLNAGFAVPTELNSPASIQLDVTSSVPVQLSWSGGGATDGGIVLYEVLFDKADGDFSNPLAKMKSDLGAMPNLSITHAALNTIARNAGIYPEETGTIKWTVNASKGGVVKRADKVGSITLTRGEGIDNIPSELYLYGSATENNGQGGLLFRCVEEGVFQIYTKLSAGKISFKSANEGETFGYYIDENAKLREGDGEITVAASNEVVRLTVNFNTMGMTTDQIGSSVRCIWGASYDNIAVLDYTGNGKFVGEGDIRFLDPTKPESNPPSWLGWVEERYYFIAQVNGSDKCWGRHDDVSAERPVGGEPASFYALYEYAWSQWDHLWKMKGSLDNTHATITIDTNADGLMIHTFTNVTPLN